MRTNSVANPPDKGSDVFGRLTSRFDETTNFVVIAHKDKMKGFAFQCLENQARAQSRSALEKVARHFPDARARMKMGMAPGGAGIIDGSSHNLAMLSFEQPKLFEKGAVETNP
jgi:urate oxidase